MDEENQRPEVYMTVMGQEPKPRLSHLSQIFPKLSPSACPMKVSTPAINTKAVVVILLPLQMGRSAFPRK